MTARSPSAADLVASATGLVSPVGADSVQTFTSVRAGIRRIRLVVVVQDDDGKPVPKVRYVLLTPSGEKLESQTDSSGRITVKETVRGLGKIVFPDLEPNRDVEMQE